MKFLTLIFLMMTVSISGCSSKNISFNDNDIKIKLIHSESNNGYKSYDIEITNIGTLEIRYLNFYLYYPVIVSNGSKGNPFKVEGKPDISKPINLKSGEKITYHIFAPIQEVYGNSNLLDFDNPSIELNGIVKDGKKEIPFGMAGGYLNINK